MAPYPISTILRNAKAGEELSRLATLTGNFTPASPDGGTPGLVIYELGRTPDQDFARITRLLESGRAAEVFVTATAKDPDLIIRAMRCGVSEFIPWPFDPDELSDALERFVERRKSTPASSQSPSIPHKAGGRMVCTLGARAGVGVTTLSVNMAVDVAASGMNTALIDLCPGNGDSPLFLDLEYTYTWSEAIRDISRLDETFLASLMTRHSSGLDILAAPEMPDEPAPSEAIATLLELLKGMYDVVFMDIGSTVSDVALAAIETAQTVHLVTTPALPCLAAVRRLVESFDHMDSAAMSKTKLILNRNLKDADITMKEMEDILGISVYRTVSEDYKAALSAVNGGIPLAAAAPRSALTREVRQLCAPFAGAAQSKAHPAPGLLSRLLNRRSANSEDVGLPAQLQGARG